MVNHPVITPAVAGFPDSLQESEAFELSCGDADRGFAESEVAPDIVEGAVAFGQIDIAQHLTHNPSQAELLRGPAGCLDQACPRLLNR